MKKKWHKSLLISLLIVAVAIGMTLTIDGLMARAQARDHIVVQAWGGQIELAQRKAFYEPFTEMTGIEIKTVEAGASVGAKLAAMKKSGNIEWDIITADYATFFQRYYDRGFLEKIDYNIVNNTQNLMEGSVKPWGIAFYLEGICMVFNKKYFPEGKPQPKGYKDFFDVEKFPGPRAMHNWGGSYDSLSIALMADGVSRDECLPIDFDRAFKMMDKVKPHIKVWYTTGAQLVQALLDEEAVIAISTDGRAKQAVDSGAPLEIVWDNAFYFLAYHGVVKDSPMKEAAMKLIKFCNRPEQQAIFNNYIGYTPTNKKAIRYIHPKFQKQQYTHPDNIGKVFNFNAIKNADWLNKKGVVDDITEKWNSWIAQ
jgi:putative spermidine/putrescine transport system substrate-binding protein